MSDKKSNWINDLYDWGMGDDKEALNILHSLNTAIDALFSIDALGWDYILHTLNIMSEYHPIIERLLLENSLCDMAVKLEAIRTVLFGGKLNYKVLGKAIQDELAREGENND